MEISSFIEIPSNRQKPKEKLDESQLDEKIKLAQQKIINNTEIIKKFHHDLEPHLSPEFRKALKSISFQYSCLVKYDVLQNDITRLRLSNAKTLISCDAIDILLTILIQLFDGIFDFPCTQQINEILYENFKRIMYVFLNYSDGYAVFGEEICKRDNLLILYRKILAGTHKACIQDAIHNNYIEILRTTIATLYNTMIYDSESNLQKMRSFKYLDIIKDFLSCKIERIKISSLLFTAYVATEEDSMLFKSDQKSVTYLLKLLSESMKYKSGRAKGLSTDELAKGIEKLSKNDENKQLIVNLGVLPILEKLLAKNVYKYKKTSLSILWSLAFDERNRKLIREKFLPLIVEMKTSLSKPEIATEQTLEAGDDDNEEIHYLRSVDNVLDRSKCSQVLDGLMWTLQGEQETSPIVASNDPQINDQLSSINAVSGDVPYSASKSGGVGTLLCDSLDNRKRDDWHIMISYCWDNSEIVLNIYNALKDLGYKLWIDKYNMAEKDNMMESMAKAVENSVAVVICISNGYKDSTNCRTEAQYAVSKKKPLIPVMVQQKYRPDGWLGFCIIGLLYCDFKGRRSFDDAMKELTKLLIQTTHIEQQKVDSTDGIVKVINTVENSNSVTDSKVITWTNSQVKDWFKEIGIKTITWNDDYTGRELSFMKVVSTNSFESFFKMAVKMLNINDLKDLRIFFENIQKI